MVRLLLFCLFGALVWWLVILTAARGFGLQGVSHTWLLFGGLVSGAVTWFTTAMLED